MTPARRALVLGLGMLVGAILLDYLGSSLQSLLILIVSFAMGIGGAIVAFRGLMDFFGEMP